MIKGYLSWLKWPKIVGTYLEVTRCLGAALVVFLVGDMDFKIVDDFVIGLWTGFTLVLVNVTERTDGFKQVLPCDVNF